MQYSRNKKHILIEDNSLSRQLYNNCDEVGHLQNLLPGNIQKVLIHSGQETASKQSDNRKTMQERQQKIFPWVCILCQKLGQRECMQDKRINNTLCTPDLMHISNLDFGPRGLTQTSLLPELRPKGDYENFITAMDLFSRYAFANSVSKPTEVTKAKVDLDIMTSHAYLQTVTMWDRGSVLVSQVIHELADYLGNILYDAMTKKPKQSET